MFRPVVLMTAGSWAETIEKRLRALGARVIVVKSLRGLETAYRRSTHVLLPGGPDLHPSYYNQQVRHARPVDPHRDALEIVLADQALIDRKPMMGICRGHQVIATAAGGMLFQDLAAEAGVAHEHFHHEAFVYDESRLRQWLGRRSLLVNSYHHQAVAVLPKGWRVSAVARDGVIEAIEHPRLPVISVQWHPEVLATGTGERLFEAFLRLDRRYTPPVRRPAPRQPRQRRGGRRGAASDVQRRRTDNAIILRTYDTNCERYCGRIGEQIARRG